MGFFNLFKNIGRAVDAKADAKAQQIEDSNAVEFSKQDITTMKNDLAKVNSNIGSIKGEIHVLDQKVKDIKAQIKKHENDAAALDAAGNVELATANCDAADRLEQQLLPLETALDMQKKLLEEQKSARDELASAVNEAEADLISIKAMADVAAANEKLIEINTANGESALASFKNRKESMQKRMIKAQAIKDETNGSTDLAKQTAKALSSGGSSRLERLRNQNNG
jgi:phage shock protein A